MAFVNSRNYRDDLDPADISRSSGLEEAKESSLELPSSTKAKYGTNAKLPLCLEDSKPTFLITHTRWLE